MALQREYQRSHMNHNLISIIFIAKDWATGWTGQGSNSSKVFFSSSKRLDPLLGTRSLLFIGHPGSSFLGIKRPGNDDNSTQCSPNLQLYLHPLPPPNILSRLGQEQLYLYFLRLEFSQDSHICRGMQTLAVAAVMLPPLFKSNVQAVPGTNNKRDWKTSWFYLDLQGKCRNGTSN